MAAAARLVEGRHDFAAFQATGSSVATTEREIFASLILGQDERSPEPVVVYEVSGSGFLRHMVRIIVGSLVEIGRGRQPVEWIGDAIAGRDRAGAGPTAPPHGLFLVRVDYGAALAAGS